LILLPIVMNAMAQKEPLRASPLFKALQRAMRASSYNCLLRHPASDPSTSKQTPRLGARIALSAPLARPGHPHPCNQALGQDKGHVWRLY
jgi:hypothetical protein